MNIFKFEMQRAFKNIWLAVSVAIGTLIGLADIVLYLKQYGHKADCALIQIWLGTDYHFAYNSLYCFPCWPVCHMLVHVIRT